MYLHRGFGVKYVTIGAPGAADREEGYCASTSLRVNIRGDDSLAIGLAGLLAEHILEAPDLPLVYYFEGCVQADYYDAIQLIKTDRSANTWDAYDEVLRRSVEVERELGEMWPKVTLIADRLLRRRELQGHEVEALFHRSSARSLLVGRRR